MFDRWAVRRISDSATAGGSTFSDGLDGISGRLVSGHRFRPFVLQERTQDVRDSEAASNPLPAARRAEDLLAGCLAQSRSVPLVRIPLEEIRCVSDSETGNDR